MQLHSLTSAVPVQKQVEASTYQHWSTDHKPVQTETQKCYIGAKCTAALLSRWWRRSPGGTRRSLVPGVLGVAAAVEWRLRTATAGLGG